MSRDTFRTLQSNSDMNTEYTPKASTPGPESVFFIFHPLVDLFERFEPHISILTNWTENVHLSCMFMVILFIIDDAFMKTY